MPSHHLEAMSGTKLTLADTAVGENFQLDPQFFLLFLYINPFYIAMAPRSRIFEA
jgi:hypothetical protein